MVLMLHCTINTVLSAVIAPSAPPPPVSKPAGVMDAMTMQSKTGPVPQGQGITRGTATRSEI